jgi:hypothetical protein
MCRVDDATSDELAGFIAAQSFFFVATNREGLLGYRQQKNASSIDDGLLGLSSSET